MEYNIGTICMFNRWQTSGHIFSSTETEGLISVADGITDLSVICPSSVRPTSISQLLL